MTPRERADRLAEWIRLHCASAVNTGVQFTRVEVVEALPCSDDCGIEPGHGPATVHATGQAEVWVVFSGQYDLPAVWLFGADPQLSVSATQVILEWSSQETLAAWP